MRKNIRNMLLLTFVTLVLGLTYLHVEGLAQPPKKLSVHVSGLGSKTDASFYQSMYEGYLYLQKKYPDIKFGFSDLVPFAETVSHLETLGQANVDLVLTELAFFEAAVKVAAKYPKTWFLVMNLMPDMMKGLPKNITAHSWRDEQGGYLSGVVAGLMTKTNKLGYIAGFDYPDIVKTGAGFFHGAKSVNPNAKLSVIYTGSWTDVQKGRDAAKTMIDGGVDVIIHFADDAGIAIIDAAKERKVWVIGEVLDQSKLAPDLMLTSYLVNHNRMFEVAVDDLKARRMTQGVKFFGLQEGLQVIAPLNKNIPPKTVAKVEEVKKNIATGKFKVPIVLDSKQFDMLWKK